MNKEREFTPSKALLKLAWNSFSIYPKQGSRIVLHIVAYHIRKNKNTHTFYVIDKFDGLSFDYRDYIQNLDNVTWSMSWLPLDTIKESEDNNNGGHSKGHAVRGIRKRVPEAAERKGKRKEKRDG